MTKAELIEFLMPFDDEIQICVLSVNPNYFHTVDHAAYGMDGDGEGLAILHPYSSKIVLRQPKSETDGCN